MLTLNKSVIALIVIGITVVGAVAGYAIQIDSNTREKININGLKISTLDKQIALLDERIDQLSRDVYNLKNENNNCPPCIRPLINQTIV